MLRHCSLWEMGERPSQPRVSVRRTCLSLDSDQNQALYLTVVYQYEFLPSYTGMTTAIVLLSSLLPARATWPLLSPRCHATAPASRIGMEWGPHHDQHSTAGSCSSASFVGQILPPAFQLTQICLAVRSKYMGRSKPWRER